VSTQTYKFVYDPQLAEFELGPDHPFKPLRFELTRTLLGAAGLLHDSDLVRPAVLDEDDILMVHDRRFVEAVKSVTVADKASFDPSLATFGLGTSDNPLFDDMHDKIARVCAATVTAVDLVASGTATKTANMAGGLHHALRDRASGFCVYNDLAIAIRKAVDHYGLRVAYLDIDAHHGDGVQWLFYDDPAVLTISLHESGHYLFPGTGHTYETGKDDGRGTSVNVPLEPFTEDESFLECFDMVVPRAIERFAPDLIVLQAGADMHRFDPLADLWLSLDGMGRCYQRVVELADACSGGRLVVTGGGGYDPYQTVPRAWARLWAEVTGQRLPANLPTAWVEEWEQRLGVSLPTVSGEDPATWTPAPRRAAITSRNRSVAERLLANLEKIWELS
jgi:acetoin utilization protein AcuC